MASAKQQPHIDQKKEVITMPLVKVKEKYQVTIPTNIREKLALKVGDILEADIEKDKIVLKPQIVLDKSKAVEKFFAVLERGRKHKINHISDEEVIKDALEAIQEVRQRKHAKSRS